MSISSKANNVVRILFIELLFCFCTYSSNLFSLDPLENPSTTKYDTFDSKAFGSPPGFSFSELAQSDDSYFTLSFRNNCPFGDSCPFCDPHTTNPSSSDLLTFGLPPLRDLSPDLSLPKLPSFSPLTGFSDSPFLPGISHSPPLAAPPSSDLLTFGLPPLGDLPTDLSLPMPPSSTTTTSTVSSAKPSSSDPIPPKTPSLGYPPAEFSRFEDFLRDPPVSLSPILGLSPLGLPPSEFSFLDPSHSGSPHLGDPSSISFSHSGISSPPLTPFFSSLPPTLPDLSFPMPPSSTTTTVFSDSPFFPGVSHSPPLATPPSSNLITFGLPPLRDLPTDLSLPMPPSSTTISTVSSEPPFPFEVSHSPLLAAPPSSNLITFGFPPLRDLPTNLSLPMPPSSTSTSTVSSAKPSSSDPIPHKTPLDHSPTMLLPFKSSSDSHVFVPIASKPSLPVSTVSKPQVFVPVAPDPPLLETPPSTIPTSQTITPEFWSKLFAMAHVMGDCAVYRKPIRGEFLSNGFTLKDYEEATGKLYYNIKGLDLSENDEITQKLQLDIQTIGNQVLMIFTEHFGTPKLLETLKKLINMGDQITKSVTSIYLSGTQDYHLPPEISNRETSDLLNFLITKQEEILNNICKAYLERLNEVKNQIQKSLHNKT
ncbi:MAG: hypothetical protein LBI26_03320 [Holosporales bacterium]|nr:hypothetical protein [Holosporales bacterium]